MISKKMKSLKGSGSAFQPIICELECKKEYGNFDTWKTDIP